MPKTAPQTVDAFLAELQHPRVDEIERIRAILLGCGPAVTEHVKWNAPSFCVRGEDRITFRLQPGDRVQLVFHRGPKVKHTGFHFDRDADPEGKGLVEWVAADRGVATFAGMADVESRAGALARIAARWILATTPTDGGARP